MFLLGTCSPSLVSLVFLIVSKWWWQCFCFTFEHSPPQQPHLLGSGLLFIVPYISYLKNVFYVLCLLDTFFIFLKEWQYFKTLFCYLFILFLFFETRSLCNSGCLGTGSGDEAASVFQVLGLKACTSMPGFSLAIPFCLFGHCLSWESNVFSS